ncbi:MAG: hypothetical protein JXX29_00210 [Deltaproteobacteria bacterium]|nr:hypothetical protein [Deltaproteobacteria bacterium]
MNIHSHTYVPIENTQYVVFIEEATDVYSALRALATKIRPCILATVLVVLSALTMSACGDDSDSGAAFTVVEPAEDVLPPATPPTESRANSLEKVAIEGQVECTRYAALASDTPKAIWDYKLGPTAAYFHDNGVTLNHVLTGPENGEYCHRDCRSDAVDWSGKAGQTLYLTDGTPGMDRTRFVWSRHEGHGGAEFNHLYLLSPINQATDGDGDSWYTASPDPAFTREDWLTTGNLTTPTAIARGTVLWSNHALVGFRNGLLGAVGTGNSGDSFPFLMLDGRVPMGIAITPNNELAFVATWNTATCRGELAVIALQSRDGYPYMLPNHGFFTRLTLLGYVALPIAAPTAVAATLDVAQWNWIQAPDLTNPDERQSWMNREPDHRVAQAGYVLVTSRDEHQAVWIDITPTMQWIEAMYLGTDDNFQTTQQPGWPLTFAQAPEAMPVVVHTEAVNQPTVVVAGYDVGDRAYLGADGLFSRHSYIATIDGSLLAFDSSALMRGAGEAPKLSDTYSLCNNPTHVTYGNGMPRRDEMLFTCRGDRALVVIGPDGTIQRTLADDRISDPIAAMNPGTRSANVITVADYANARLLNYQDGPLQPWGDDVFSNQPDAGSFVYLGLLQIDGSVVSISAAEVP